MRGLLLFAIFWYIYYWGQQLSQQVRQSPSVPDHSRTISVPTPYQLRTKSVLSPLCLVGAVRVPWGRLGGASASPLGCLWGAHGLPLLRLCSTPVPGTRGILQEVQNERNVEFFFLCIFQFWTPFGHRSYHRRSGRLRVKECERIITKCSLCVPRLRICGGGQSRNRICHHPGRESACE